MTEVFSDVLLEILKAMQNRLIKMQVSIAEIKSEFRAPRNHMIGMKTVIARFYNDQAKIELRQVRFENRLELSDAPV